MSSTYEQISSVASPQSTRPSRGFSLGRLSQSGTARIALAILACVLVLAAVYDPSAHMARIPSGKFAHYAPTGYMPGMGWHSANVQSPFRSTYLAQAPMHVDAGPVSAQPAAGGAMVRSAANSCAEEPHGVCYGSIGKPTMMAVRQCTHGYYATKCQCFTNGGTVLSEVLVGPRCFCNLVTEHTPSATWAMVLFCEKAENADSDSEARMVLQPQHLLH